MYKQPISFFSAQKINSIKEYVRFRHTIQYIRSKSPVIDNSFKLSPNDKSILKEIMKYCSFSNFSKFLQMKNEWDNLRREIPLSYFQYLDIQKDVLNFTLEIDHQDYEQLLRIPRYPRFAIVRLMAGIYKSKKIPEGLTENEAIEYLLDFMGGTRFRCCLNYPQLLSIFLEPNRKVHYIYYPPEIVFTKKYAIPVEDGSGIGMSYGG